MVFLFLFSWLLSLFSGCIAWGFYSTKLSTNLSCIIWMWFQWQLWNTVWWHKCLSAGFCAQVSCSLSFSTFKIVFHSWSTSRGWISRFAPTTTCQAVSNSVIPSAAILSIQLIHHIHHKCRLQQITCNQWGISERWQSLCRVGSPEWRWVPANLVR